MTKRQNPIDVFRVNIEEHEYIVTLERLKNDANGNGTYKAVICFIDPVPVRKFYNAVYTFTGHYLSSYDEARWIVEYYERETKNILMNKQ